MSKTTRKLAEEPLAISAAQGMCLLAALFAGLLLALGALMLLPSDRYFRWQQTDGTILFRARWVYERIHFDPTPIDIALIGSSRMEASVRAAELSQILSKKLNRPVHVVNFGLPQEGRNLHWAVAQELLTNRQEVKLILLSAGAEAVLSHPGFRFLGDDGAIIRSPLIYNNSYLSDALTLPYRHLSLFIQSLWPQAFQLSTSFDPAIYAKRSFDPAESFVSGDGKWVNRRQQLDPTQAAAQRAAIAGTRSDDPKLRLLPIDQRYAVERYSVRQIAELAKSNGTMVAFLRVPVFGEDEHFADPGFYRTFGPVFEANQFGNDPQDYMDLGHLGRKGTARLVPWLADQITPLMIEKKAH